MLSQLSNTLSNYFLKQEILIAAKFGAGAASTIIIYQPTLPDELKDIDS